MRLREIRTWKSTFAANEAFPLKMHLSGNLPPGYSFSRLSGQVNGAVTLANLASSGASQRQHGFKRKCA